MRYKAILIGLCVALLSLQASAQSIGDFIDALTRDVVKVQSSKRQREVSYLWLIVASRDSAQEAIYLAQSFIPTIGDVSVVRSSNGRFAVVAGFLTDAKSKANKEALRAIRIVPSDSFLSRGDNLREVIWTSGGEFPNTEVVQRRVLRQTVMRLQSALSRLGLYSGSIDGAVGPGTSAAFSEFVSRFGPQVWENLDEYSLASIEQAAMDGFRSEHERVDARQRGFTDAASMTEALNAGFTTNTDYTEAKRFGFGTKTDFDRFRSSGFATKREFEDANLKGFATKTAFDTNRQQELANLQKKGGELLDDAEQFLRLNPKTPNIVELASAAAALKGALGAPRIPDLAQRFETLSRALASVGGFDAFAQARTQERQAERQKKIAALTAHLEKQRDAIRLWMAQNLTHQATGDLADEMRAVDAAIASGELEKLTGNTDDLASLINRWGLKGDIDKLVASGGSLPTVAAKPDYTITPTPLNAFLLNGSGDEWVAVYNASPSAPSIIRNLVGDYLFEKGFADVCTLPATSDPSLKRAIEKELSKFGATDVRFKKGECASETLLGHDVLLFTRRDFLKSEPSFAIRVLDLLASHHLRDFSNVSNASLRARQAEELDVRQTIAREVEAGARNGFGALLATQGSSRLCAVVTGDTSIHGSLIEQVRDFIGSEGRGRPQIEFLDAEKAYRSIQREECNSVYASADDLKLVSGALTRDGKKYEFIPVWFDRQMVANLEQDKDLTTKQQTEALEAKRLAAEEQRKIEEAKELRRKSEAAEKEKALQAKYGAEARALQTRLADGLERILIAETPKTKDSKVLDFIGETQVLFPIFVKWNNGLGKDFWTVKDVKTDIIDYGSGAWKERRLDQIALQVNVHLESAKRGERRVACYKLGVLADDEFATYRDPLELECSAEDAEALSRWATGHQLESRWRAY